MSYPQCITCNWYKGVGCKAYPLNIPKEITDNQFDHKKPYPGDHGIQYQERKPVVKKAGPNLTMTGKDTRPDTDYDPEQLAMGIKVEMEHTDDPEVAKKIAKDQLDEDPKYYSHEG